MQEIDRIEEKKTGGEATRPHLFVVSSLTYYYYFLSLSLYFFFSPYFFNYCCSLRSTSILHLVKRSVMSFIHFAPNECSSMYILFAVDLFFGKLDTFLSPSSLNYSHACSSSLSDIRIDIRTQLSIKKRTDMQAIYIFLMAFRAFFDITDQSLFTHHFSHRRNGFACKQRWKPGPFREPGR